MQVLLSSDSGRNPDCNVEPWMYGTVWVLPVDYCKKGPCNFNTEIFVSKVGNPCPTLGQLLASRILYALLAGEKQYEIDQARFCTQSCAKVGQLLVNSSPTPHRMGSCRGLPCNSPLATPWTVLTCVRNRPRSQILACLGNGRNTVSRVLFRKRELTEFCGKLGEFCEKLGEF